MDVYLVNARPLTRPSELEALGIFDSREAAQAFIERAPMPQRDCLEIHTWTLGKPTSDPFWTGKTTVWTEAGRMRHDRGQAVIDYVQAVSLSVHHFC